MQSFAKYISLVFIALTLSSYSSKVVDKLLVVRDSYLGYSSNDLVRIFGTPKSITPESNNKIYNYGFTTQHVYVPPTHVYVGNSRSPSQALGEIIDNRLAAQNQTLNCDFSFTVAPNGIISRARVAGNSCEPYAEKHYVNPKFILDLPKKQTRILGFDYERCKKGIKVTGINDTSLAFKAGLKKGDVIETINGTNVIDMPIEFANDAFNNKDQLKLTLKRHSEEKILNIEKSLVPELDTYSKSVQRFLGF